MQHRCPGHQLVGAGILEGYRWIVSKRGYANIVKSASDAVQGLVYGITESDEQRLDDYEGVTNGCYRKEVMPVKIDGHVQSCLVYVDPVEEEGTPQPEYIHRINSGLAGAKLPSSYIERYVRIFIPA